MEFTSELDKSSGVCKVIVTGEVQRPDDSDTLKRFAIKFSAEYDCNRFLFDLKQTTIIGGTMNTFSAANPQGELADGLRKIRTAVVRNKLTSDDQFFETVAVNRGFQLNIFDSEEKAKSWLLQT